MQERWVNFISYSEMEIIDEQTPCTTLPSAVICYTGLHWFFWKVQLFPSGIRKPGYLHGLSRKSYRAKSLLIIHQVSAEVTAPRRPSLLAHSKARRWVAVSLVTHCDSPHTRCHLGAFMCLICLPQHSISPARESIHVYFIYQEQHIC